MVGAIRKHVIFLLIAGLVLVPIHAAGITPDQTIEKETANTGEMAFDLLALRPLGFLATTLGAGIFLLTLPLSAAMQSSGTVYEQMVEKPAAFTFKRPIGNY